MTISFSMAGRIALDWLDDPDLDVKLAAVNVIGRVRQDGAYEALQKIVCELNALQFNGDKEWELLNSIHNTHATIMGDSGAFQAKAD